MLFNSTEFLLFFPLVLLLYFIVPKKARLYVLFLACFVFYASWEMKYVLLMTVAGAVTFFFGLAIDGQNVALRKLNKKEALAEEEIPGIGQKLKNIEKKKKGLLITCLVLCIGVLAVFKYCNFFLDTISSVISHFIPGWSLPQLSWTMPVGISFFTFQAMGYLMDVYRGKSRAEDNFFRHLVFLFFFPLVTSGPIERSDNLLLQLKKVEKLKLWNVERIFNGAVVMLWGYFIKLVIADRLATIVASTLSHEQIWQVGGTELLLGILAFSVQIYCDFAGYSTMAVGAAQIMGFTVIENFNAPYFSCTIKEFWRRWHISLSTWFRDYLYIPLGGNRKGKARKYLNLMIVFLVSGFWHGAGWTYLIWGALHGAYQIIGDLTAPLKKSLLEKWQVKTDSLSYRLTKMGITFVLVNFAWIFFRAESLSDAWNIISRLFTQWDPWTLTGGVIYRLGLSTQEINILFVGLLVLLLVDLTLYRKKQRIDVFLQQQTLPFRWGVVIFLLIYVLVFGLYGPTFDAQNFIYAQF